MEGTNVHVVSCLGYRSDGALLSCGWDKTVRVWDANQQVAKLEGHSMAVNAVVGLPTGEVASGSGDQSIGIWQADQKVRSLNAGAIVRALCCCGGNLLASAANDGMVRVWDITTSQQKAQHKVADSYLYSIAYHSPTNRLAAGADDGTVVILALDASGSSLRLLETLQHLAEAYGVAFLDSGDLAVACGDNTCMIWTQSPARVSAAALRQDHEASVKALMVARGATIGAAVTAAGGASYEFSHTVELGNRKMTLQWNRGEDAQTVAARFVTANGLDPAHTGDVVNFVMQAQQQAASGGTGPSPTSAGGKDFNYPVEVADGRRLQISWNRGDDPQAVALAFARQHGGIAANELPDIVNFIQQVSGGPASPPVFAQQAPAAPPSPEIQQQAMLQIMEMGFDEATARNALSASGWSVEAAIQRLLG